MDKISRRDWLKMGAGASAWAGLGACVSTGEGAESGAVAGPGLHELATEKGVRFGSAMAEHQLGDPEYLDIIRRECATIVAENEHK